MGSLQKVYKNPPPRLCRLPSECSLSSALSVQEGDPSVSYRSQAQGRIFHLKEERRNKLRTDSSRGSVSSHHQESMASSRLGRTPFISSQLTSQELRGPLI